MNPRPVLLSLCVLFVFAAPAVLADDQPRMPVTTQEYEASRGPDPRTVAPQVVRLYNLRRVFDNDLPAAQRAASLLLVEKLGGEDAALLEALSVIVADPKTPTELQKVALEHLLRRGQPNVSGTAVRSLPTVPAGSPLRQAILEWLAQNGDASMLPDVVKAWAQELPTGGDEARYRRVVEKLSGQPWEQALLAAINSESFFARGSAMTVLAGRTTATGLSGKIASLTPHTEAMAALKASVTQLGYVPDGGTSLLAVVSVYRLQPDSFQDVARLARQWKGEGPYEFNIRDFHLLSRLTADPLRTPLKRENLAAKVSAALAARQHVTRAGAAEGADSFAKNAASLSMADLWNLHLLSDMLAKPRVLLKLRVMADYDRGDTRTEWGGLIVYENGGAEARLYPPEANTPADDLKYVSSKQMVAEGRDSVCRLFAHFEKTGNIARAGPTAEELRDAKEGNYYGLVLTTLGENEFCAHYFNPQGTVISLGRYAFKF
jgi:hypothetical protein